jgi:protocatechuate 3,4-dioxygenase beta subunit
MRTARALLLLVSLLQGRPAVAAGALQGDSTDDLAPGAVHGVVVDEEGEPIAGAEVLLREERPRSWSEEEPVEPGGTPPAARAVTDANGGFRFEALDPERRWRLTAGAEAYLPWGADTPVRSGGVWNERITLLAPRSLRGTVRAATNREPILGALLVLDGLDSRRSPSRVETSTDSAGEYRLENVSPVGRTLVLSAPGFATRVVRTPFQVGAGARLLDRSAVVDFELRQARSIAGRVLGPAGPAMPGIDVVAYSPSIELDSLGSTTSAEDGSFRIEGLAEGLYTVEVRAPGFAPTSVEGVRTETTDLSLTLVALERVSGIVLDPDGRPLESFGVQARKLEGARQSWVVTGRRLQASPLGAFELEGLPPGTHVIEAWAPGFALGSSEPFEVVPGSASEGVTVRLTRGGSLSGLVVDGRTGAPVAGAEVSLDDEAFVFCWPWFTAPPGARTDAAGRFEFAALAPGEHAVRIHARGHAPRCVTVRVSEGLETELSPQVLSSGASVTGVVHGLEGKPVPGATVQLTPADANQMHGNRTARTDATGRFWIGHAQPGCYQLSAVRPPHLRSGDPFEAIGDMRRSQKEVVLKEGESYELDLELGDTRAVKR